MWGIFLYPAREMPVFPLASESHAAPPSAYLTSYPVRPRGSGAGPNLIAGCDSKLSASFAKNAWRSGQNLPTIVVRLIRPCSHLSFIELIAGCGA